MYVTSAAAIAIDAVDDASVGDDRSLHGFDHTRNLPWNLFSVPVAFLLLVIAVRVYLGRIEMLIADHTVFSGITYTDAHVFLAQQATDAGKSAGYPLMITTEPEE